MRYPGKIRGKPGLLPCSTIVRTSHWNATLLPITLSSGLGCLVGTYRIEIWITLRNRLRTITMLVHHRPNVGNYVSSCCTGMNYYYTVYLKYLNMNTQQQQMFDYTEWKLPLLVDQSDSDRCLAAIAWASCCLVSVEQCLAAFAWASCCLLFIITFGTSESCFHNIYFNTITIFFSV